MNPHLSLFWLGLALALIQPQSLHADYRSRLAELGVTFPLLAAHRGASMDAPESTDLSFRLAKVGGAEWLEGDAFLTRDGVLIVHHDDTFARTTNVAQIFPGRENDPVSTFTWAEVQTLNAGSWYNQTTSTGLSTHQPRAIYERAKVLRLEQLLEIARRGNPVGLFIEIKAPTSNPSQAIEIARATVHLLREKGWINGTKDGSRILFEAFEADTIRELKKLAPSVPVLMPGPMTATPAAMQRLIVSAHAAGADIVSPLFPYQIFAPIAGWMMEQAHQSGLAVLPWGVDDVRVLGGIKIRDARSWSQTLLAHGADGVISDNRSVYDDSARGDRASSSVTADLLRLEKEDQGVPILSGQVIYPNDPRFDTARRGFAARADYDSHRPRQIVLCKTERDVINAVNYARTHGLKVSIRSGGHNYAGFSSFAKDGLIIDLAGLKNFSVMSDGSTISAGPGLKMHEIYEHLGKTGRTLPLATGPTVGLGGLVLAGGVGVNSGKYGTTADHLISARVVLASGQVVTASATQNPELYWSLKGGGGGNVGIVTEFKLSTHPVGWVGVFDMTFDWNDFEKVFGVLQNMATQSDPRTTGVLALVGPDGKNPPYLELYGMFTPDGTRDLLTFKRRLKPVLDAAKPRTQTFKILPSRLATRAVQGLSLWNPAASVARYHHQQNFAVTSGMVSRPLTPDEARRLKFYMENSLPAHGAGDQAPLIQILDSGNGVRDARGGSPAAGQRNSIGVLQINNYWTDPRDEAAAVRWTQDVRDWAADSGWAENKPYIGYVEPENPSMYEDSFGRVDLTRLRGVKALYDPTGFFEQPVSWTTQTADPCGPHGIYSTLDR